MSDPLANPRFLVGIPIGDCNLATPSLYGYGPGWAVGYNVDIRSEPVHADNQFTGANPLGAGRSMNVAIDSGLSNGPSDTLTTPPTPFGMVPRLGFPQPLRLRVAVIYRAHLPAGATAITLQVSAYNGAGAQVGAYLNTGSLTSTHNTSGLWLSHLSTGTAWVDWGNMVRYYRVSLRFNATANGTFALDFIGLGFMPDGGTGELTEPHVIGGLTSGYDHRVRTLQPDMGTVPYQRGMARGVRLARVGFGLERVTAATRNTLEWLHHVSAGTPSGGDVYGSMLGGWHWPVLLLPNHPGMKQALYARVADLSLDVDTRLGFVESTPTYSGHVVFEEVSY